MRLRGQRKRAGEGADCDRLLERLEEAGAERVSLHLTQGYWTHAHQDCERWVAHAFAREGNPWGIPAGFTVDFHSWDTVKACARRGIDIVPDQYGRIGEFDVYAR